MDTPPKPGYGQLKIGRFIILRSLGGDRNGKVFLAFDPDLERPVTIRWLKPADVDQPHSMVSIDLDDARTVAALDHPHTMRCHETGTHKDYPYFVFAGAAEIKCAIDERLATDKKAGNHDAAAALLERMERQKSLPAMSNNLLEINRLTDENNHANVGTLANIVLRDYAITNKLLQLANSSFYGSARDGVKTVSNAIKLLGMSAIRTTCNGLVFFNALKNENQHLKDALISSFTSALIGRHFATRLQRHDLAEEAFICGMFYRLGKSLAIFYFQDESQKIRQLADGHGMDEEAASARVLGISYGDLGVTVAERWKFPDTIRHSLQCLGPGKPPKPIKFVDLQQQIAAFSNELCEPAANTPADQGLSRLTAFANRFSGIIFVSPAELVQLLDAAFKKMQAFSPVLGLELPGSRWVGDVGQFLAAMQPLVESVPGETEQV